MSNELSFLSEKSLAIYEIGLIDQFSKEQEKIFRKQLIITTCIIAGFCLTALLAIIGPALLMEGV